MTTNYGTGVLQQAQAWLAEDPDPDTRSELARLIERASYEGEDEARTTEASEALAELGDRFSGTLEFGTAGLRGAMGAGPNRMNRVVVLRAAAGLVAYLRARGGRRVVVGYDARHLSERFARDTAAVVTGAGLQALVLPRPLPTPVLAFAVRHLGCDAGVMVTASHNPPQDNGYKVYLGDGAQIVPPTDTEIAAEITAVGPLATLPLGDEGETLGEDVLDAYLEAVAAVPAAGSPRDLRVVYTPMHGVGRDVVLAAMARAGFPEPSVVTLQAEPDPDFPTVQFPNPEEPGAMDLALAAAREAAADLVLANDPDADRCAAAVPAGESETGWRMLTGDEVGALLGDHLLRRGVAAGGVLASSIVSSSMLARIAASHGVEHRETLTGFKWIARVEGLRYGYEEALGYCVDPESVRDKDGVSAALLLAELAASLAAQGRTLPDRLDDLAREHGVHATDQLSVRVRDLSLIQEAMARLRQDPPSSLGGLAVEQAEDLSEGAGELPPTDGLRYRLTGGARVVVRPSGTEPKLKCYLEAVVAVAGNDLAGARQRAAGALAAVRADLVLALGLRTD